MSITEVENEEELNRELDLLEERVEQEKRSDRNKQIVSWVTSFAFHSCFLMFASALYFASTEAEIELPPSKISVIIPTPDTIVKKENNNTDILEREVVVETEDYDPEAKVPVTILDLPEDVTTSSEDDMQNNTKLGREEAVGEMEMGANAFFNNIGARDSGSGMFGNRKGGGDRRTRQKMGPMGKPAAGSVDAGLRWLKKHQSPNGMWDAQNYFQNCNEELKCEPGSYGSHSAEQVNVAMTGYAIACFLGSGYDHKTPSKYKSVVDNAIQYLLSIQKPNGLMGERNYEHPVATLALVEAYGMTGDQSIKKQSQLAVDVIISRQLIEKADDPYSALLWDYVQPKMSRVDLSTTCWNIMALKSAIGAGLDVKESVSGAKKGLERVWKAANKDWDSKSDPYKDMTVFPYTWNPTTNETQKDHLSFAGATCAVFLGVGAGDIMLETLLNDAEHRWVKNGAYKRNDYAVYYLTLAQFQAGGDRWKLCLDTVIPHCIEMQDKTNGCVNGSWASDSQSWAGKNIGRVLSTCYNILALEVAYRYAKVHPEVKLKK